jgi:hypothetical protein
VLSLLAVVAVLTLWTAESVWHEHADHADHHDCPICQVAQHYGALVVVLPPSPAFVPVLVSWLPTTGAGLSIDEPCRRGASPRGPPPFSLL